MINIHWIVKETRKMSCTPAIMHFITGHVGAKTHGHTTKIQVRWLSFSRDRPFIALILTMFFVVTYIVSLEGSRFMISFYVFIHFLRELQHCDFDYLVSCNTSHHIPYHHSSSTYSQNNWHQF